MRKKLLSILALLCLTVTGAWAQSATDVSSFSELQSALSSGNNVRLTSDITCTVQITIASGKKVEINGNGKTLIGSSYRAFEVSSSAVLSMKNLTITGFASNVGGGAIQNNGTLVFDGCTISNNHTTVSGVGGGAIQNGDGGKLYAINTTFSGNYSKEIGGAINNYGGSLYLSGCTFSNNYTTHSNAYYGGAIGVNTGIEIRIVNCTFSGNKYNKTVGASDLGVNQNAKNYTIAGCTGITIQSSSSIPTYEYGTATLDYSDLNNISFTYNPILSEATGITDADALKGKAATFSRTFTASVASTICLPFPMTSITGGKAYAFTAMEKVEDVWTATMSEVTSTAAGQPYLFKSSASGAVSFSGTVPSDFTGVAASATPVAYSGGGTWTFCGTYSKLTYGTDLDGAVYGFAAQSYAANSINPGDFVKAETGAYILPFRCYLTYNNASARSLTRGTDIELPSRIIVRLVDKNGSPTAIGTMDTKTGEVTFGDEWYSLDGRRLQSQPTQKGVYINKGNNNT